MPSWWLWLPNLVGMSLTVIADPRHFGSTHFLYIYAPTHKYLLPLEIGKKVTYICALAMWNKTTLVIFRLPTSILHYLIT